MWWVCQAIYMLQACLPWPLPGLVLGGKALFPGSASIGSAPLAGREATFPIHVPEGWGSILLPSFWEALCFSG